MTPQIPEKHQHYWLQTETDKKGVPTKYKCSTCLMEYERPYQKNFRDYLKLKYSGLIKEPVKHTLFNTEKVVQDVIKQALNNNK